MNWTSRISRYHLEELIQLHFSVHTGAGAQRGRTGVRQEGYGSQQSSKESAVNRQSYQRDGTMHQDSRQSRATVPHQLGNFIHRGQSHPPAYLVEDGMMYLPGPPHIVFSSETDHWINRVTKRIISGLSAPHRA